MTSIYIIAEETIAQTLVGVGCVDCAVAEAAAEGSMPSEGWDG
jgi:hypothetical protein